MPIVPQTIGGKIAFYESRIGAWEDHSAAIGLDPGDAAALKVLISAAREAFEARQAAINTARSATDALRAAVAEMHRLGATDIARIRTFAQTTGSNEPYTLANIPVPAEPAPLAAPGTPSGFSTRLLQTGALELRWKCRNPSGATGTLYQVRRRIGGQADFEFLGARGLKSFLDDTLPAGAVEVEYEVIAIRSTRAGNPARFTVKFGTGAAGARTAANAPGVKMAA